MKINLTDQELNEWVAIHICGFSIFRNGSERRYVEASPEKPFILEDSLLIVDQETKFLLEKSNSLFERKVFDPCNNLNHAHLMEEKISETKYYSEKREYFENACRLIGAFIGEEKGSEKKVHADFFQLLCLSARQRCEAAWLTFNEGE